METTTAGMYCMVDSIQPEHLVHGETGESIAWSLKNDKTLSPYELEEMRQQRKQQRDKLNRDIANSREKAYQVCRYIWDKATPPNTDHLYLVKKQVSIFGIRQYKDRLVIPVRDISGRLISLQFISPSGEKCFKSGGKVKGGFHRIGSPKEKNIYIAEGYATAATIHEQTGHSIAVAFNAGNLVDVAIVLRDKYPGYQLIICADNDRFTDGNPGLTKARKAAKLTDAGLLIPTFTDDEPGSDFNDRYLLDINSEVKSD